jgi:hypothetical protein
MVSALQLMRKSLGRDSNVCKVGRIGRPTDMDSRSHTVPLTAAATLFALQAGCFLSPATAARGAPPPCLPSAESSVMHAARNDVADRLGENRHRLPWIDSTPPAEVHNAAICGRAAQAYARGAAPGDPPGQSPRRAGVVRAGGLYFVVSPPAIRAGEFMSVGVLDPEFHWLVGLTM